MLLAYTDAKFQGTITKIRDSEVTCVFGDAFDEQYRGIPCTVQFNLGRTNYKRNHFANQTAVEYLGEDFLFPEEIKTKPPRILTYEAEMDNSEPETVKAVQVQTMLTIICL